MQRFQKLQVSIALVAVLDRPSRGEPDTRRVRPGLSVAGAAGAESRGVGRLTRLFV